MSQESKTLTHNVTLIEFQLLNLCRSIPYGEVTAKIQNSEIVLLTKVETMKPEKKKGA
jgi:hypothetical protein